MNFNVLFAPGIYRRSGGKKRQLTPIGKSVSVSFRVRVVRACVRAKLCEHVREVLLNAGASDGKKPDSSGGCIFSYFDDRHMGFKVFFLGSMLYAWAF